MKVQRWGEDFNDDRDMVGYVENDSGAWCLYNDAARSGIEEQINLIFGLKTLSSEERMRVLSALRRDVKKIPTTTEGCKKRILFYE